MFLDLRQVPDGTTLQADLCIIGAGAAGITIARQFIGRPIAVLVVESGDLEPDEATQSLYKGSIVGRPYFDLDVTRLRYFGGSTNHWGGWCAPLHDLDFEARDWVPHSGWPIARRDLDSYYAAAQSLVEIGPPTYDPLAWQDDKHRFPDFQPERMVTQIMQLSEPATHFGERYRDDLAKADNVRVLLNANALGIDSNAEATSATGLRMGTFSGARAKVHAAVTVVACGGLESPRVLLLSNDVVTTGLGNQHDLVGRFFMEHPHIVTGSLFATDVGDWHRGLSARFKKNGTLIQPVIATSPIAQREQGMLGYSANFETPVVTNAGYPAYRHIRDGIADRQLPDHLGHDIWNVVTGLDDVARGMFRATPEDPYHPPYDLSRPIRLYTRLEQCPNPDSRVKLIDEKDALGLNRIALDWRLTELDKRSLRRSQELIGAEFGRLGVGRFKLDDWVLADDSSWPDDLHGGHHHIGTCRMSDDPKQGVVDRDCRVHGFDNLYVAGSAVYPTTGYVNPTLTVVALALRLADHLKTKFRLA
ncbi:MAG TPA: GMC family oxidoreductase [Candidatus Acidoferrum sp.]|nr:GMC family oxidoreductase [Candidatus Acidoferrum sp.]